MAAQGALAMAALRDAEPSQGTDDDAGADNSADTDARFGAGGQAAVGAGIGDDGDGLGRDPGGAVAGVADFGALLRVIATPAAIGTLVLGRGATLVDGREQGRLGCRLGRGASAAFATLGPVGATVSAEAARAQIEAGPGALAVATSLLRRRGAAGGDGAGAEEGRRLAVGVAGAVGSDGAAPGIALGVDIAVAVVLAALVAESYIEACVRPRSEGAGIGQW